MCSVSYTHLDVYKRQDFEGILGPFLTNCYLCLGSLPVGTIFYKSIVNGVVDVLLIYCINMYMFFVNIIKFYFFRFSKFRRYFCDYFVEGLVSSKTLCPFVSTDIVICQ